MCAAPTGSYHLLKESLQSATQHCDDHHPRGCTAMGTGSRSINKITAPHVSALHANAIQTSSTGWLHSSCGHSALWYSLCMTSCSSGSSWQPRSHTAFTCKQKRRRTMVSAAKHMSFAEWWLDRRWSEVVTSLSKLYRAHLCWDWRVKLHDLVHVAHVQKHRDGDHQLPPINDSRCRAGKLTGVQRLQQQAGSTRVSVAGSSSASMDGRRSCWAGCKAVM